MNPLITVIVPIYNVEAYLRRCVDSIINQTHQNLEIILVNDGSPDGCGVICDEYAAQDERVRVIHKENGGVGTARNAGLEAASGDWIGFVDPDDWIALDMYAKLLAAAVSDDTSIAACGYTRNYLDDKKVEVRLNNEVCTISNEKAIGFAISGNAFSQSAGNKLFRRDVVGLFDEDLHNYEDALFVINALMKCKGSIAYTSECLYHICVRKDGASSDFSKKRLTALDAWDKIVAVASGKNKNLAKGYAALCATSMAMRAINRDKKEYLPIVVKWGRGYFWDLLFRGAGVPVKLRMLGVFALILPKLSYVFWRRMYRR